MHFTFKLRDQLEGNAPMTYNKGSSPTTTTTSGGLDPELKPYAIELASKASEAYGVQDPFVRDGSGNIVRDSSGEPVYSSNANTALEAYKKQKETGERLAGEAMQEREDLAQFKEEGPGAAEARNYYRNEMGKDWNQLVGNELLKTAGQQDFGMSRAGALGSARADMAKQGALTDKALDIYAAQNRAKTAAAQGLETADKAFQNRYMGAVDLGKALGEAEYKGSEAGVRASLGSMDVPFRGLEQWSNILSSGAMPTQETQTQTGQGK